MIRYQRLIHSFRYAAKGLAKTFKEEQNLRIQSVVAAFVIILGMILKISVGDWALLFIAILFVLLTEVINSALERVTDVLKPRINGYVKEIKDIMAAAVLLATVGAVIVGLFVFMPYLIG